MSARRSRDDFFREYLAKAPVAVAFWRSIECHRFSKEPLEHPVLDVGCGDGLLARVAFGGNLESGIDVDAGAVRLAAGSGCYRQVLCASATKIPFAADSFKTVISNCALEHVADIDSALREIRRVLQPDGRLMITVPSERFVRDSYFRNLLAGLGLPGLGDWYVAKLNEIFKHYHVDDAATWRRRLQGAGLRMEMADYLLPVEAFHVYERWMVLAFPSRILKRVLNRWVIGPRGPVRWFATRWLRGPLNADGEPGACYFITARKDGGR